MNRVAYYLSPLGIACLFVGCGSEASRSLPTTPDRATIEAHSVQDAAVYQNYAVVRLPIESGVPIWNPSQILPGPDDRMYVANHTGEIFILDDTDGDGLEDTAVLFSNVTDDGLRSPAGLAFKGNDLYVGTAQQIRIYTDTDGDGVADESRTFFDAIPFSEHPYEWTSALAFDDEGWLYFVLTTDSWNAGASPDPELLRGSLIRVSPDGSEYEQLATGLRSVHGLDISSDGNIVFVDNEGGGNPTEELNIVRPGAFYGHNPEKYGNPEIAGPDLVLRTEVAPAGIEFRNRDTNDGAMQELFIAYYGPGERWHRGAIGKVHFEQDGNGEWVLTEVPVATGLAKVSDLSFGPTGDLYVAQVGVTDYWYQPVEKRDGAIYRLIEAPWVTPLDPSSATPREMASSPDVLERGKQLFAERACSACHATDGKTQLLGPNLKDIGRVYSRAELLEEIEEPSKRIKPSMVSTRVTRTNGDVLLGRIVGSDDESISVIGIGNVITRIDRADVQKTEDVMESMMYTGLLYGLTEEEVDDLLSYLISLSDRNE